MPSVPRSGSVPAAARGSACAGAARRPDCDGAPEKTAAACRAIPHRRSATAAPIPGAQPRLSPTDALARRQERIPGARASRARLRDDVEIVSQLLAVLGVVVAPRADRFTAHG